MFKKVLFLMVMGCFPANLLADEPKKLDIPLIDKLVVLQEKSDRLKLLESKLVELNIYLDKDNNLKKKDVDGDWSWDGKSWWRNSKNIPQQSLPSNNCPNGLCPLQRK